MTQKRAVMLLCMHVHLLKPVQTFVVVGAAAGERVQLAAEAIHDEKLRLLRAAGHQLCQAVAELVRVSHARKGCALKQSCEGSIVLHAAQARRLKPSTMLQAKATPQRAQRWMSMKQQ